MDKDAEFVLGNSSGETVPHPGSEGEAPISPTSIASTSTGANHNTTPNPTATFHANGSNNSQHSSNSTSNEEHSQNPTTPTTLRGRSRASKRFSFASVSNAFMGAVKSVRSVSQQGRDLTPPPLYPNPLNGTAGSNTYRDSSPDLRDRGMSMGRGTSRDVARGLSRDVERRYPFSPIRRRTSVDSGATGLPLAPAVSNVTASGVSGGVGVSGVTKSTFGRVTGALGLDTMEGKEYGDGWKEFRTGKWGYGVVILRSW